MEVQGVRTIEEAYDDLVIKGDISLTKDEAREWMVRRVKQLARCRFTGDLEKDKANFSTVVDEVYGRLVDKWPNNYTLLDAMRKLPLELSLEVVAKREADENAMKNEPVRFATMATMSGPGDGRAELPYYASMVTLDEAFGELEKSRVKAHVRKTRGGKLVRVKEHERAGERRKLGGDREGKETKVQIPAHMKARIYAFAAREEKEREAKARRDDKRMARELLSSIGRRG
jgi:hypothetical protein